jgi:hypothetical protein
MSDGSGSGRQADGCGNERVIGRWMWQPSPRRWPSAPRDVRLRWRTVPLGRVLQRTALLADLEDAWIRARAGEDGYLCH